MTWQDARMIIPARCVVSFASLLWSRVSRGPMTRLRAMRPSTVVRTLSFPAVAGGALLSGCAADLGGLRAPQHIVAPFNTVAGEPLWAVAPPRNESGTSVVPVDRVGDAFVAAIEEAKGLSSVPYNRTLEAMAYLGIDRITTPAQAQALAQAMNVDGILVPSVTAWDPYDPPTVGLSVALFPAQGLHSQALDINSLVRSSGDSGAQLGGSNTGPTSVVSEYMDAHHHDVLMAVREYAEGRSMPESAIGWRMYTASSELFLRFATHRVVRRVVQDETLRLARQSRRLHRENRVDQRASVP